MTVHKKRTGYWKIEKSFDFCYGHRVHNQSLNGEYSIDTCCKCRHLHGHQGRVQVVLRDNALTNGMVTDFKHLNWFKKFIDDVLDHKFIIDINDPMFSYFISAGLPNPPPIKWLSGGEGEGEYGIVNPDFFKTISDDTIIEVLEGFVVVKFVPTSENLSHWLYNIVDSKMKKINVHTTSVTLYETPKSNAMFIGGAM